MRGTIGALEWREQAREQRAAEQETDPELKEKLWKEYVDYKRGAQGKS